MKVGLIRHFKVDCQYHKLLNSDEYNKWATNYDIADVIENTVRMGDIKWDRCYASDLHRAVKTANTVYKGNIIQSDILREVPMASFTNRKIVLPCKIWSAISRIAWLFSHKSQKESKHETINRVKKTVNEIINLDTSNILLVSHGFFLYFLQKELIKNGFKGKKFTKLRNGELVVFEK
ncbi:histidine phosphatase family protein [Clostridiaceae bacterium M8S5]|nr:histidine phosphatase family protein [Clostridiaceae bacterium M8S5]